MPSPLTWPRRARPPAPAFAALALGAALILPACAPALDWRELRLADTPVQALFPCKPTAHTRRVQLAGQTLALSLHACTADGQTWAVAVADVGDPARVGAALAELNASAAANVGAEPGPPRPLAVPGATPQPGSVRQVFSGRLPDGQPLRKQTAAFSHGTWVVQATAQGPALSDEAADTFIAALRVLP